MMKTSGEDNFFFLFLGVPLTFRPCRPSHVRVALSATTPRFTCFAETWYAVSLHTFAASMRLRGIRFNRSRGADGKGQGVMFEIPRCATLDSFRQYTGFQYHYVKSIVAESLHITAQRITLGIEECTKTPCALKGQHKITNKMGLPLDKLDFTTYICALNIIYVSIIIKIVRSHYLPC